MGKGKRDVSSLPVVNTPQGSDYAPTLCMCLAVMLHAYNPCKAVGYFAVLLFKMHIGTMLLHVEPIVQPHLSVNRQAELIVLKQPTVLCTLRTTTMREMTVVAPPWYPRRLPRQGKAMVMEKAYMSTVG